MAGVIQNFEDAEKRTLEGIKCTHPGLYVDPENGIVMLNRNRKNRVALLCGAKAAYEPFGSGFVGEGMLTAHISGKITKAPSTKVITQVINNLAKLNKGGILVLLLNYPVQVLNFGLAIEKARLKGIMIESFVITDDCARTEDVDLVGFEKNLALRRGLTGSAFVFKILGTMSSLGYKLWEILEHAMTLNFRMATIGFATRSCTLPGETSPLFYIPRDEVIVGCGLHGDRGVYNIKVNNLRDIIKQILPKAVHQSGLRKGDSCCVLVNNMGSVTNMELYCVANEVDQYFGNLRISIERLYVGTMMTFFNTKGVLISVLNCTCLPEWLSYLDMRTEAFAWPGSRLSKVNPKWPLRPFGEDEDNDTVKIRLSKSRELNHMRLNEKEAGIFRKCLNAACEAIMEAEDVINRLNGKTGNGDCGTNMKSFALNLMRRLKDMPCYNVSNTFYTCSSIADELMSGTIGTLYSIAFNGAAMNAESWVSCWESAINQIMKHTSAKPGYRTLLDSLVPAYEIFVDRIIRDGPEKWLPALAKAVEHAECGSFKTASMKPKVGRAKYISENKEINMDAGAYGVYVWLKAVYEKLVDCMTASSEEIPAISVEPPQINDNLMF